MRWQFGNWNRKLHALEAFNGQYFFNLPTLKLNFSVDQLNLLQQAYDSLSESVYANLVMQTRLKPYLDQIELVIDNDGIRLDAAALNQKLAEKKVADPENHLADLLDLDKYANSFLTGTNWRGPENFENLVGKYFYSLSNDCANGVWRIAA
ncbi:MAG: hypothetical protein RBT53_03545 [Azonexus sp.]|jgi:hypothetical protein|nr:hypothetical protein [Azonexus sp.]